MGMGNPISSRWLIITVALLSMIGPFSIDTYLPSFPDIERDFHINRALLSQSLGFYLAAAGMSTLFWGPLSDRIGRRFVILGTLGIYLLASLGCALAADYKVFLVFRILQGIAASGGMVAGRAMIRDAHDSHEAHRAMAYVMMLFAVAPAIAPVIGGWLHDAFGWRSVFYFLAIYSTAIIGMTFRFLHETLASAHRQSFHPVAVLRLYFSMLIHSRYQALVFSLGSCFGGLFLYIAASPTVIFDFLKLDVHHFGLQFIPMTAGIIVGSFVSGRLSHYWKTRAIVSLALGLMATASLLNVAQAYWLTASPVTLIAPQVLYAFGIALAMPGFSILAIDCFPKNRGAAAAVQSFIQMMITALVASLLLPALVATVVNFALAQATLLGSAILLWFWAIRCQSRELKKATY
jgi:DHA1 family bicyclomycin/chloramphenicol resistance-like MFS transporter